MRPEIERVLRTCLAVAREEAQARELLRDLGVVVRVERPRPRVLAVEGVEIRALTR